MAFTDLFHEIDLGTTTSDVALGNMRISGKNISFVKKFTQKGGLLNGAPALQIALINDVDKFIYQADQRVTGMTVAADVGAIYTQLYAAGMTEVVTGQILTLPSSIAELDYDNTKMRVNVIGDAGWFTFDSDSQVTAIEETGDHKWAVPATSFIAFRDSSLTSLTTPEQQAGEQADHFIVWSVEKTQADRDSGSYIQFTGGNKNQGNDCLMNFVKTWSLGITLAGFAKPGQSLCYSLFNSDYNYIGYKNYQSGTRWQYSTSGNATGNYTFYWQTYREVQDGDRLLIVNDASGQGSPAVSIYIGRPGFAPHLVVYDSNSHSSITGGQGPNETFSIGQGNDQPYNYTSSFMNWPIYSGLNNFIALSEYGPSNKGLLTELERTEYFECNATAFTSLSFYNDLFAYAELGADTYPNVVDAKGNLTGGEFHNGSATDFRNIKPVG